MNSKTGSMLLLAIAVLLVSGSAFALGAKGDGMDPKDKGMMTDDSSMQKHDETKMKQETMKEEPMKDEMKPENGTMMKDDNMGKATMKKMDTMKDSMK